MPALLHRLPLTSLVFLTAHLVILSVRSASDTTLALIAAGVALFAFSLASAIHLLGPRSALTFVAIAMAIGWFAEQMGTTRGWFFGDYHYTDVLGPTVGAVPAIIPLNWFSLVYIGYVIANLIVWKRPVDRSATVLDMVWMSLLTAFIVTAFDLSTDPYMVYELEAWIMEKTDGAYFGETVEGFVGWVFISFVITMTFRLIVRKIPQQPVSRFTRWHALMPVLAYLGFIAFFVVEGVPVETRSIAVFAMGMPVLAALAGWSQWEHLGNDKAEI